MQNADPLIPLRYPGEVVITDVPAATSDGSNTPAGDADDDFFSSWDKPSIKRPSNPPSRTGTPPVVSRTASPFLNAGANGNGRSKSPLSASEKESSPAPTAIRTGTAVRKGASAGSVKKGSVLGAKKAPKLGAKKVAGAEVIDFDEAERKAKEEAERIEKLGYDPEAEKAEAEAKAKTASAAAPAVASPAPVSSSKGGFGATSKPSERSSSDVERLGMGMGRLGFGQTASSKPAPSKLGFGSVGPVGPTRTAADGLFTLIKLVYPITNPVLQMRKSRRTRADSVVRRVFRPMNSSVGKDSIPMRKQKPSNV